MPRDRHHRFTIALGAALLVIPALVVPAGARASVDPPTRTPLVRAGVLFTPEFQKHARQLAQTTASPMQYGGGPVVTTPPRVYLIFWGPGWGTATRNLRGEMVFSHDPLNGASKLQRLFKGLGTGGERWSAVMTQYCEAVAVGATSCPNTARHVAYPAGGALAGVFYDTRPIPTTPTADQIAAEAVFAARNFGNTTSASNRSAQYVILSPTGFHPDGFGLPGANFCAWHSAAAVRGGPVAFTNLPYVMDLGAGCAVNFVGTRGALDGYTVAAGHEYAETLTDPLPTSGWNDPAAGNQGETGDKCPPPLFGIGSAAPVNVATATGTFALPATWSNDTQGCQTAHTILPTLSIVPSVVGHSLATAHTALTASGLPVGAIGTVVDCNFLGTVRSQNPAAGLTVPTGTPVNLIVGKAPSPPAVCP